MLKDAGMTPASGKTIPTTHRWNDAHQAHCSFSVSYTVRHTRDIQLATINRIPSKRKAIVLTLVNLENSDGEDEDYSKFDTAEGTASDIRR